MFANYNIDKALSKLPGWVQTFILRSHWYKVTKWAISSNEMVSDGQQETTNIEDADVFSSRGMDPQMHRPVIDLDVPAYLIPSSTEGHSHLIIDHEMPWHQYVRLLEALVQAGLVEENYVEACKRRGQTMVRMPWVKKNGGPQSYI